MSDAYKPKAIRLTDEGEFYDEMGFWISSSTIKNNLDAANKRIAELESALEILENRAAHCETMDKSEKYALVRALQEIAMAVGLSPLDSSPKKIVDAVDAMAAIAKATGGANT